MEIETICLSLLLISIIAFTIIGNILVIFSVFLYKPLHTVHSYYLVSLAVADLTVAVFIMPLAALYVILGKWMLGDLICHIWLTGDVLCCTASIWNLCAIACDRYFALTDPVGYAQKRTTRRTLIKIAMVWLISLSVSLPALLGWNDWSSEADKWQCNLNRSKSYLIYSASGTFYVPLLIMTTVYVKIYSTVKKQLIKRISRHPVDTTTKSNNNERTLKPEQAVSLLSSRTIDVNDLPMIGLNNQNILLTAQPTVTSAKSKSMFRTSYVVHRENEDSCSVVRLRRKISLSKERKAVRVMTIIMAAFVLCWLPFFTTYLIPVFSCQMIPTIMELLFIWLGYVNSALNPLIYTVFNNDFRRAFQKITMCKPMKANDT